MYADRYRSTASRPAGAGAALLISNAMILGLYFAGPTIAPDTFTPPIVIKSIPIPDPPKPTPTPQARVEKRAAPSRENIIVRPDRQVIVPPTGPMLGTRPDPGLPPSDLPSGTASGGSGVTIDPPRAPVLVDAAVDPRFADALQPPYPASELRAETEGSVTVRVLIGVDGRVKAFELISSPSEGLANATRRHALARWRFKPATRDGIPVESWKRMTLRFRIIE